MFRVGVVGAGAVANDPVKWQHTLGKAILDTIVSDSVVQGSVGQDVNVSQTHVTPYL